MILIQGVEQSTANRLLPWAKRFDLGVTTVAWDRPFDAVAWFANEGARADLAFVSVRSLLDPKVREFWATRQGGVLPLVAVGTATDRLALEQFRGQERFPELAEPSPPSLQGLRRRLGDAKLSASTVFLWDPHERFPKDIPPYLIPFGISRLRRSPELKDFIGEDRTRLAAVIAELSDGGARSPLLWADWSRAVETSGVPSVAILGPAFVSAMAGYQALSGLVPQSRVWDEEAGISAWDELRPQLRQLVERGRALGNFLREADVFLKRGVVRHALGILEHAVSVHPASAPLWSKWGEALSADGDDPRAIECWRRALRLEPGNLLRWTRLVAALTLTGKNDEALAIVREGAERFCWDVTLRSQLGSFFRARGDAAAAGIEFARAALLGAASRL